MAKLYVAADVANQYGWDPILHLVDLVSEYFDAPLIHQFGAIPLKSMESLFAASCLWSRRRNPVGDNLVFIAARPSSVLKLLTIPGYKNRFNKIAVWIVDSFWTDKIMPKWINSGIDKFFITTDETEVYQSKTGVPTEYLPWGSDVLQILDFRAQRDVDLIRLGRQPAGWQCDKASAESCGKAGITFLGSPPAGVHVRAGDRYLQLRVEYLMRAKFVLAFSNLCSNAQYTHPSKEYFTARWTDSLACGAIVAGIPPKSDRLYSTLWPGALLEFQSSDRDDNIRHIRAELDSWNDRRANFNTYMSLKQLDWRHRLKYLAGYFDLHSEKLRRDLDRINQVGLGDVITIDGRY